MPDKIDLKIQIIQKAASIFSQKGYEKTSMNLIASAVEMGKSSLYYYFESKNEIFRKVVEFEANELNKKISDTLTNQSNPLDKIRVYVLSRLQYFMNYPNLYKALKSERLETIDFIKEFRHSYYQNEIEQFKKIIDEGVEINLFSIYDSELAATAIITAIKGMETPLFINNLSRNVETTVRDAVSIILYGIVKR